MMSFLSLLIQGPQLLKIVRLSVSNRERGVVRRGCPALPRAKLSALIGGLEAGTGDTSRIVVRVARVFVCKTNTQTSEILTLKEKHSIKCNTSLIELQSATLEKMRPAVAFMAGRQDDNLQHPLGTPLA
jgi:hypothetical protein